LIGAAQIVGIHAALNLADFRPRISVLSYEGILVTLSLLRSAAAATLAATCLFTPRAQAALGQLDNSVTRDITDMHAVAHASIVQAAYSIHEITLPSGTEVREYVAPNGIVFGVAWSGPTLPDLKATLGAAFDRYAGANPTRRASPLALLADDLVVYSAGHLRAFVGHAYLPHAVPAGVDVNVIQ
jgi:hypothetical protein